MSTQKINDLIVAREKELAFLLENRGTDFPVVERQNDLRISYIELELVDLKKLIEQPKLNKMQQKLLNDLKQVYSWQHSHAWDLFSYLVEGDRSMFEDDTIVNFQSLSDEESLAVVPIFIQWVLGSSDQ